MRVINIIEVVDNSISGVESFGVWEEQLSQEVVDKAEALFKAKAIENGCPDAESYLEGCLEDGWWSNGDYTISIVWSDLV
jgi:hypothetical protein